MYTHIKKSYGDCENCNMFYFKYFVFHQKCIYCTCKCEHQKDSARNAWSQSVCGQQVAETATQAVLTVHPKKTRPPAALSQSANVCMPGICT